MFYIMHHVLMQIWRYIVFCNLKKKILLINSFRKGFKSFKKWLHLFTLEKLLIDHHPILRLHQNLIFGIAFSLSLFSFAKLLYLRQILQLFAGGRLAMKVVCFLYESFSAKFLCESFDT